jgi:aspartyl-tRNA synthetase
VNEGGSPRVTDTSYRNRTCGDLRIADEGQTVQLCGWVCRRRDHGGLIFADLRDRYGVTQIVIDPSSMGEDGEAVRSVRLEYVVRVEGTVSARPPGMVNASLETGEIEVRVRRLRVLAKASPMPFQIEGPIEASEDIRLTYRYLDLRRPELQRNLSLRSRLTKVTRDILVSKGFLEVETPLLTRRTPEGARDYLVPSRIHAGKFYALPQSPQLYKQLLMFGGLDRYFQIARCFRDEDLRADRQPEFTQIDVEMSFVEERDLMGVTEELFVEIFGQLFGTEIQRPFPCMTYSDAMERFGTDRPDLRFSMDIVDFSSCFGSTTFQVIRAALDSGGRVRGLVVRGGARYSRKDLSGFEADARKGGARGLLWLKSREGEWAGSMGSHLTEEELRAILDIGNVEQGDLVLLVAGPDKVTGLSLDILRRGLAAREGLCPKDTYRFVWVLDPPLFEVSEEDGSLTSVHHPFTSPRDEHITSMERSPLGTLARAYDIVLNGVELGGGSIRIHDRALQERVFRVLGMEEAEYRDKFGFLLEALEYGSPPHGGIALGLDRIVMMVAGAGSLREVIAFPKTTAAQGLMEGSPSGISDKELVELHIRRLDNPLEKE